MTPPTRQRSSELRRRKKRSDKPFALMAFDLASRRTALHVIMPEEAELLQSRQAPVVLLERRRGVERCS